MIDYPDYMPPVIAQGYGIQTVSPMVRSKLDTGRASQRRGFTGVPTVAKIEIILNNAQAQAFETFYRWTLNNGASWFRIKLKTPLDYALCLSRFTGVYDGPNPISATHCKISAELEIDERQTL